MLRMSAAALAAALCSTPAWAQSPPASPASSTEKPGKEETAPQKDASGLILSLASRARYETVGGRPRPGYATSEDAVLLRTGVAIEYGPGAVGIGGELIDSRAYDLDRRSFIRRDDINALEVPQAYIKVRLDGVLGPRGKIAVEAGRFLLNFGSGRLIATDEYRNTVNGFTGLRVDLEPDADTEFALFYVLPQEHLPSAAEDVRRNKVVWDRESFDRVLFGLHAQRKRLPGGLTGELAYYRLAERDAPGHPTADRRLHNLDARLAREPKTGTVDYDAEAVYQFGWASSGTEPEKTPGRVSAGFAHAAIGYSFDTPLKLRLGLFYDVASGDRAGRRFGRFDTLFGSRRDDLGPSGSYAMVARENISAPGIRAEVKPGKRFEVLADYRPIWLASRYDRFAGVSDPSGRSGSFAGHQVEGRVRYWLIPDHLRLESNFALLRKGGFLRNAPGALATNSRMVRFLEANVQVTF